MKSEGEEEVMKFSTLRERRRHVGEFAQARPKFGAHLSQKRR